MKTSRRGRPTRQDAARLTDRIIETATRMFLEKGYAGTTMEEVAIANGAAKRSLYSRFPSKAELFRAVTLTYASTALARLSPVTVDRQSSERQLEAVCIELLHLFLAADVIAMERIVVAEAVRFPEIVPILEDARIQARDRLSPILRQIALDARRDDVDVSDAAQALWDLTIASRVRGAALGLCDSAVTEDAIVATRSRIALFLRGYC